MAADAFKPMDRLDHEDEVEFLLVNDTVVLGRMLKGGINGPSTRSYWTRDRKGRITFVRPVCWRDLPGSSAVAEWATETPGETRASEGATKGLAA